MLWSPPGNPWPDPCRGILLPLVGWLALDKAFNLADLFGHLQNEDQVGARIPSGEPGGARPTLGLCVPAIYRTGTATMTEET